MKKIYKYGTGMEVPKGAEYLWSYREEDSNAPNGYYVWHYFLVETK
uniref:Uncharacterized protein n=1 Tax=viral metagenome TaxID=1070528 RepID=A0A6M3JE87_9ZZZZ